MEEQKVDHDGLSKMPHWQQMQYKSFRAWVNYTLSGAGYPELGALTAGLKDGLALVALLEKLSSQTIKGIQKNPKMRIHFINNLSQVFTFVKGVPIKIESIMPEDIADGNVKLILGFIWMLILHYQISKSVLQVEEPKKEETNSVTPVEEAPKPKPAPKEDPKMLLLARVNNYLVSKDLADYQVKNFTDDWQSGLVFNALIYGEDKELVDLPGSHGKAPLELLSGAFKLFKEEWGLPHMLDAEDLVSSKPDEKSVMTYASLILDAFAANKRVPKPKVVEEPPPPPVVEEPPAPIVVVPEEPPAPIVVEEPPPPPKPKIPIKSLHVRIAAARKLKKSDKGENSDPFCFLEIHNSYGKKGTGYDFKTHVVKATRDPVWNRDFAVHEGNVDLDSNEDQLVFNIVDWDLVTKNDPLGYVKLKLDRLEDGVLFDEWLPIHKHLHKDKLGHGQLHVIIAVNEAFLPTLTSEPAVLRIVGARDLIGSDKGGKTSDPYVLIKIKGKKAGKRKTKVIKQNLNPEWEEEFEFAAGELTDGDTLQFIVFDWDLGNKDDVLGHAEFFLGSPIKTGLHEEGQLHLLKGKKSKDLGQGSLHVQLAYGRNQVLPPLGAALAVRIAGARDLRAADASGYSDPYVVLKLKNRKDKKIKYKTKVINQSLRPEWNESVVFEAGATRAHRDVLAFHIYDWDQASKKDPLGLVLLPLSEVASAGSLFDKWLEVRNHKNPEQKGDGYLHVLASWGGALPPVVTSQSVSFRIAEAKGILGADKSGTSDAYAELSVAGKKLPVSKTKVINKTLTPVWDEDFVLEQGFINLDEDVLNITILDKDKIGENTPLGVTSFPFKLLKERSLINEWLPLNKPNKPDERGYGEVRVVAVYGRALPPAQEQFVASVVAAKGLRSADKGGTSDPYVIVKVPGKKSGKLVLKTAVMEKTLDPAWKQDFEFEMRDFSHDDVIEFRIFDFDKIGENDPLGTVSVPFSVATAQPFHQNWFPLQQPKNAKKPATGELFLRFAVGEEGKAQLNAEYGVGERPATIGGKDTKLRVAKDEAKKLKKQKEKEAKKQSEVVYDRKPIPNFQLRLVAGKNLPAADVGGTSDPYVVVHVKGTKIKHKSKTIKKTLNPVWNETVDWSKEGIDVNNDVLTFAVYDWDRLSKKDLLGTFEVPVRDLIGSSTVDKWFHLMDPKNSEKKGEGEVHLQVAHGQLALPPLQDKKKAKEEEKKKKKKEKEEKKDKKKKEKEAKKDKKKGK